MAVLLFLCQERKKEKKRRELHVIAPVAFVGFFGVQKAMESWDGNGLNGWNGMCILCVLCKEFGLERERFDEKGELNSVAAREREYETSLILPYLTLPYLL